MDLNYLKKILKIFDDSTATNLEVKEEGVTIKISNTPPVDQNGQMPYPVFPIQAMAVPAQASHIQHSVTEKTEPAKDMEKSEIKVEAKQPVAEDYHELNSPIVGTFFRSPSPDSDPFVEVGTKVKPGDTLCIVEAMKLMNEIECDIAGSIEKILIENAQPVEYNQPLFIIKPD